MGNSDGLLNSMMVMGDNEIIKINKNDYFSFAHGDEIALVIKGEQFYILNCSNGLWEKVKKKVKLTKSIKIIKNWWFKQSRKYIISNWSCDFNDIK